MDEIRCSFCGCVLPKYTIDFAGYDKRTPSSYACCECWEKIEALIDEGECDVNVKMRMAMIESEEK